jgi:hypothetical protein
MATPDESATMFPVNRQVTWLHAYGPLMAFRLTRQANPDFNLEGGGGLVTVVEMFRSTEVHPQGSREPYHTRTGGSPLFIAKFQGQTDSESLEAAEAWADEMHRKSVYAASGNTSYDLIRVFKDGDRWRAMMGEGTPQGLQAYGNTEAIALAELAVLMSSGEVTRKIPEGKLVPKTGANVIQHGGTHYKVMAIEPWDYILANGLGYCEGNAIKYLTRWKDKGGVEDLKKAQHYIQKLIEVAKNENR